MKKGFKLLLVLMILFVVACSNETVNKTNVKKIGNEQVEVRLDKKMFEGYSDQEIIDEAIQQGVKECQIDGQDVIYLMSEEFRQQMLSNLRTAVDNTIQTIHNQDLSIVAIRYSQDFKTLKIRVNSEQSYGYENIYAVNLVTLMSYYQMFYGYEEQINIICEIIDDQTNTVIADFDYQSLQQFASSMTYEEIPSEE